MHRVIKHILPSSTNSNHICYMLFQYFRIYILIDTDCAVYFVLRYKDGNDYIGEHKDDETELVAGHPIASLSLGEARDFVFRHQDSRGRKASRCIDPVSVELQHGTLLMIKHPTNNYWYHWYISQRKTEENLFWNKFKFHREGGGWGVILP